MADRPWCAWCGTVRLSRSVWWEAAHVEILAAPDGTGGTVRRPMAAVFCSPQCLAEGTAEYAESTEPEPDPAPDPMGEVRSFCRPGCPSDGAPVDQAPRCVCDVPGQERWDVRPGDRIRLHDDDPGYTEYVVGFGPDGRLITVGGGNAVKRYSDNTENWIIVTRAEDTAAVNRMEDLWGVRRFAAWIQDPDRTEPDGPVTHAHIDEALLLASYQFKMLLLRLLASHGVEVDHDR